MSCRDQKNLLFEDLFCIFETQRCMNVFFLFLQVPRLNLCHPHLSLSH